MRFDKVMSSYVKLQDLSQAALVPKEVSDRIGDLGIAFTLTGASLTAFAVQSWQIGVFLFFSMFTTIS